MPESDGDNRDTRDESSSASEDEEGAFFDARYPPDEEADLLTQSNEIKAEANKIFASGRHSEAITTYERSLAHCPIYLHYDIAVIRSNIAACHLKLEDWKAAVEAATASIDCLERVIPTKPKKGEQGPTDETSKPSAATTAGGSSQEEEEVIELEGEDADGEEAELKKLVESDQRREDVLRIRAKALMRRGRAKMELGGWANLQGAQEDYNELLHLKNIPARDEREVRDRLRTLPARINDAREKEVGEMMGKLKDLGNGVLKPFGLSTDNFQFTKDENTGGYSMAFNK